MFLAKKIYCLVEKDRKAPRFQSTFYQAYLFHNNNYIGPYRQCNTDFPCQPEGIQTECWRATNHSGSSAKPPLVIIKLLLQRLYNSVKIHEIMVASSKITVRKHNRLYWKRPVDVTVSISLHRGCFEFQKPTCIHLVSIYFVLHVSSVFADGQKAIYFQAMRYYKRFLTITKLRLI